ncbi:hypothetical protein NW765_017715 [Fusarium oxysporum]|nr:hypothetical protein NW765_017715 [Fusarium oxysporum]KAJ4263246.1 hypothetical protein NW764_016175 [Fusarium oxysporum]
MAAPTTLSATDYIPSWASDCPTCEAIWCLFADPESFSEVSFGSHQDIASIKCPNHKELAQTFSDFILSEDHEGEQFENGDMGLKRLHKGLDVMIIHSLSKLGSGWNLRLANKHDIPSHPGHVRLLDTKWADVEILKKWKHRCLSSHGEKCENPLKVWPARPAWLIDVEDQCIVPGHISGAYVAISYTYGKHTPRVVTSNDFMRLEEPSALTTSPYSNYVSPMIRHAMYITMLIGERYLWADALCITHFNPEAASEQLQSMGAIYANAIVTIIAADSDSESGILGLKGVSHSREIIQPTIPFGDETLVRRWSRNLEGIGYFRPYFSRGWTFQEYAMSKRKIIFHDFDLHWACACSTWNEDLTLDTESDMTVQLQPNLLMAGIPDELFLGRYINSYNERSLTFDEDAFPAISGLLSIFSRSFEGGFLYGLPEMFFDHSLGWEPSYVFDLGLQRRVPSERPIQKQFASSDLPSWSWLGWKGSVDTYYPAIQVIDQMDYIEEVFPITEWYTSSSPMASPEERRRIHATWYERRDGYKDFTKPMPPGWTRRDATTGTSPQKVPRLYPEGCDRWVFKHEAMPELWGEPLEWYYPFPLKEIQASTPPFMPEQTQYLFCETVQARLSGYSQDPSEPELEEDHRVILCDRLGSVIGSIKVPNQDLRDRFPKTFEAYEEGFAVDIVAVCKLKRDSKTWNEEKRDFDFPVIKEDLYLILWIEWKEGIAYRLASGRVNAAKWERLDLEKVSLVLG